MYARTNKSRFIYSRHWAASYVLVGFVYSSRFWVDDFEYCRALNVKHGCQVKPIKMSSFWKFWDIHLRYYYREYLDRVFLFEDINKDMHLS